MLQLQQDPTIVTYSKQAGASDSATPQQQSMAMQSAVRQLAVVKAEQKATLQSLRQISGVKVIYSVQRAYNGIAVYADAGQLDVLRKMPNVKTAQVMTPRYPTTTTSVKFIGAPKLWRRATALTGQGVKVGIIDTGVDYIHRDFGGSGTSYSSNNNTTIGDVADFPGARVVGGTDLCGDGYSGSNLPIPDPDPMDANGHGTHVAGITAGGGVTSTELAFTGPYDGTVAFDNFLVGPGVAPKASIYAVKVFGASGSTNLATEGIEWCCDPNQDGDMSDHLNVVNMSLGSKYGVDDADDVVAANNAALLGVCMVISAGNDGDTNYVLGSPGCAQRDICVASSYDDGIVNQQLQVNSPSSVAGKYIMVPASFGAPLTLGGVTGDLALASNAEGCSSMSSISGKIAVIDRGTCNYSVKVKNAQNAGAIAAIVVNNVDGEPVGMGGVDSTITIPSVMIGKADGTTLKTAMTAGTVNATMSIAYPITRTDLADMSSSFTSRGPSRAGSALKPDISAPGSEISSAKLGSGTQSVSMSGTSMAAPHIAGCCALLLQQHPGFNPESIKALLLNTATHDLYLNRNQAAPRFDLARGGAGRVDLANAANAHARAFSLADRGAVNLNFGVLEVVGSLTKDVKFRVVNTLSSATTYKLTYDPVVDAPGVAISFPGGGSITVPANGQLDVTVRLTATASAMKHNRDASLTALQSGHPREWLSVESGHVALVPQGTASEPKLWLGLYAVPRAAGTLFGTPHSLALSGTTGMFSTKFTGAEVYQGAAHPTDDQGLGYGYDLQYVSPNDEASKGYQNAYDLRAIGICSVPATPLQNTELHLGVSTYSPWQTPNTFEFDMWVDDNLDGYFDFILYNINWAGTDDVFSSIVYHYTYPNWNYISYYPLNVFTPDQYHVPAMNTNAMDLRFTAKDFNLSETQPILRYYVEAWDKFNGKTVDTTPVFDYDISKPAFKQSTFGWSDRSNYQWKVPYNQTNMASNKIQGILVHHRQNMQASSTEIMLPQTAVNSWGNYK